MIVSCPSCDSKYQVADDKVAGNVLRTRCKSCGSQILVDGTIPPPKNDDEDEDDVTRIMRPEDRPDAAPSRPPSSGRRWTVHVGKDETRPMTSEDVVNGVLNGSLRDDASIWKSGMANWANIADVPELVEAVEAGRRRARSTNGKSPASAQSSAANAAGSPASSTSRMRTSKPPPPVRTSVLPSSRTSDTKAGPSHSTQKQTDAKQPADAQPSTGDLYAKIASKVGASKPSSMTPAATETKSAKQTPPARSTSSKKEPAVVDVQPTLDPTAAPEDFYAKILAKVRPAKEQSVPPAATPELKSIPSARKTLPPPTWGAITHQASQAHASPPLPGPSGAEAASVDIEIPIETDVAVAPAAAAPPSAQAVLRRTSPAPPLKRQEPAIPVDIQLPPMDAASENRPATQVVLPGTPAVVTSPASVPPTTSAAAVNSVQPTAASVVVTPSSPPPAVPVQSTAQVKPVAASKPSAEVLTDDTSPGMRAYKQGRSRRFVGTMAAILVVGLLGVGGGVAATVYALKSPGKDAKASVPSAPMASGAAVQPSNVPARVAENLPATQQLGTAAVDADEQARAGGSQSARAGTAKHATRVMGDTPGAPIPANVKAPAAVHDSNTPNWLDTAAGIKEKPAAVAPTPASKTGVPAAPDVKPAKSGAPPFNRDAAMAVLGIAASQAPSCKRPGGPTGSGKALVTFDSDGTVIITNVIGEGIAGTPVARCVASLFQRIRVAPFSGDRQTVSKPFTIPP